MIHHDILIVGSGVMGVALADSLNSKDFSIGIVESNSHASFSKRHLSINQKSLSFLKKLGVKIKIEGRKILTDNSSMKILYVSRVTDPNEYDELLRETLSAALAADIAYAITSSNPVAVNMYNLYKEKLKEARFVDATEGQNIEQEEGMADVIDAGTFINSRY